MNKKIDNGWLKRTNCWIAWLTGRSIMKQGVNWMRNENKSKQKGARERKSKKSKGRTEDSVRWIVKRCDLTDTRFRFFSSLFQRRETHTSRRTHITLLNPNDSYVTPLSAPTKSFPLNCHTNLLWIIKTILEKLSTNYDFNQFQTHLFNLCYFFFKKITIPIMIRWISITSG